MPTPYEISFKIADIVFRLSSPDQTVRLKLEETTCRFSCHNARPDVEVAARWQDLSNGAVKGRMLFDPGESYKLYEQDGAYLFAFYAPAADSIPYKAARMRRSFTSGEVLLHPLFFEREEAHFPLDYPLDELLFVNVLSRGKGVELHACGMTDANGNGHLFVGQSGAGKSTIAQLLTDLPGITILSDDRIAVRTKGGNPWMFGTPWHGDAQLASPDSAPLRTVLFLSKHPANELVPLPRAAVVQRLFACSFLPFFDPTTLEFALSFLDGMACNVACYELRFRPDREVAGLVEKLIYERP